MSEYRYYAKPGIDMSGLVPPDAERMTREQLEERMAAVATGETLALDHSELDLIQRLTDRVNPDEIEVHDFGKLKALRAKIRAWMDYRDSQAEGAEIVGAVLEPMGNDPDGMEGE